MVHDRFNSKGTVLVESVVVLPVILLLVFGVIQLALYLGDGLQLNYAAYQGSRTSFVDGSNDGSQTQNHITNIMPGARIDAYEVPILGGLPGNALARKIPWKDQSYHGVQYRVLDVTHQSRTLIPFSFKDAQGRPLFPKDGLTLHARGFCPMLEKQ